MKTVDLKKAERSRLNDILNMAQTEPVAIRGADGRNFFLLSDEQFEQLEDAYWAMRADQAIAENNWIGVEESEALLQRMLNAKDKSSGQSRKGTGKDTCQPAASNCH